METTRRDLLRGLAALGLLGPAAAHAKGGGGSLPPPPPTGTKVLEIFCSGGLSCFDTLMGRPAVMGPGSALPVHPAPWVETDRQRVSNAVSASTYTWSHMIGGGQEAYYATNACSKLFVSSSIANKYRVLNMAHALLPHEAAAPYTLTGTSLGRPEHAGTAAAVHGQYGAGANGPTAYVLYKSAVIDALRAATTGQWGSDAYPPLIEFDGAGVVNKGLYGRTSRPTDPLLDALRAQFSDRRDGVRSAGHDAYEGALTRSRQLSSAYALLQAVASGSIAAMIELASRLLALPDTRYVCVVDPHYDSHWAKVSTWSNGVLLGYEPDNANYHNARIQAVLGGVDAAVGAGWLNLSTARVAITTEFGRRCEQEGGSGHHPFHYAQLVLAHGLGSPRVGNQVLAPAQFRAGLLHALGVDALAALGPNPDAHDPYLTLDSSSGAAMHNVLFA
jgi:hypothetical protein